MMHSVWCMAHDVCCMLKLVSSHSLFHYPDIHTIHIGIVHSIAEKMNITFVGIYDATAYDDEEA